MTCVIRPIQSAVRHPRQMGHAYLLVAVDGLLRYLRVHTGAPYML